jgi:hypothetical protein
MKKTSKLWITSELSTADLGSAGKLISRAANGDDTADIANAFGCA